MSARRPLGEIRGPLANRCLGVLRELLHMLADSWTQLGSAIKEFLEGIYQATTAISTMAISEHCSAPFLVIVNRYPSTVPLPRSDLQLRCCAEGTSSFCPPNVQSVPSAYATLTPLQTPTLGLLRLQGLV